MFISVYMSWNHLRLRQFSIGCDFSQILEAICTITDVHIYNTGFTA